MQDFEKLGVFYLGRIFDLDSGKTRDDLLLYESKDLTTHAVCVGMTGSGKTGLCLTLLEEAAIDGIPAIAVDPKGDLGNLLLTFPELRPEDFLDWIDPAEATRKGMTRDALAAKTADSWKRGLADWGQDQARIARFKNAVDVAVYTPGSTAGLPLTVLRSFSVPSQAILENNDALRDRVAATASGLLSLLGRDADPLKSREHILVSNIFDRAWRGGRSLDMAGLIREMQSPPFDKVGVMDLESFFPAKERFALAMEFNNLLASPGFAAWMEGEPLDIQRLLYTPEGKPRLSIISIAHLGDAERMFFVTILLNEVISWMRSQSGTSSLRALLYMDEIFGYFPPTANPPSKTPMLTLLKQARAYGLGVVLATQNPVDLDYKGLANAGTWFLGRLQTQRDKARVLDGLEGASAAAGAHFDRSKTETILSGLGSRVFLMNNVHNDEPVVFQTRWILSYLSGPLTRDQIQKLMHDRKTGNATVAPLPDSASAPHMASAVGQVAAQRPMLPPDIEECFLSRRGKVAPGSRLVYRPSLSGSARLHFAQSSSGVDVWREVTLTLPVEGGVPDWENAAVATDSPPDSEKEPEQGAAFADLPAELARAKTFVQLTAALKDFLYRTETLTIWKCPLLNVASQGGESEGDFRARLKHRVNEQRDLQVEKLRAKYAPKLATLQDRLRRAAQKIEKEKSEATQHTIQSAISFGASVLGAMFGRKLASTTNITRAASTVRQAGRAMQQRADVGQAEENSESVQQRLNDLDAELKTEAEKIQAEMDATRLELESAELKPRKADIAVGKVVLAWTPYVLSSDGTLSSAV